MPLERDGTSSQPSRKSSLNETIRICRIDSAPDSKTTKRGFLTVIRSRVDLGVHMFIDGPTLIGRDPKCTITLHDFRVSSRHATICKNDDGDFILEDLQSTNGTFVNRVLFGNEHVLRDGDKIFVGETVLRFSLADEVDIDFHSEVETLVGTDPLTGLPSKRRFDKALEFAIQAAGKNGDSLAMLMMDLDGVKQINDTHGHLFGAHVISESGRLIAQVLGSDGRACRFGGDEFSAFIPRQDVNGALSLAEKIRIAVETAGMKKDEIPLQPTISIGVAALDQSIDDPLKLVATADKALYRAKRQGRNRVAS